MGDLSATDLMRPLHAVELFIIQHGINRCTEEEATARHSKQPECVLDVVCASNNDRIRARIAVESLGMFREVVMWEDREYTTPPETRIVYVTSWARVMKGSEANQ